MRTFPTSPRATFLEWCQGHTAVFTAQAEQIGLTIEQAGAFSTATTAAAAALLAQQQAIQQARAATQAVQNFFAALRGTAGDTVRLIRAFAETQANPTTIYNLAQIPPPAQPSPAPPPAQPTELRVALDPSGGQVELRWKAANPAGTAGTSYIVRRRLPGEAAFTYLGTTGKKRFVDATLPAGVASVQYTVQGQRSDQSGPLSPICTVQFGAAGDGGAAVLVTTGGALTMYNNTGGASRFTAETNGNGAAAKRLVPAGV